VQTPPQSANQSTASTGEQFSYGGTNPESSLPITLPTKIGHVEPKLVPKQEESAEIFQARP
jgi:hypothetical protein